MVREAVLAHGQTRPPMGEEKRISFSATLMLVRRVLAVSCVVLQCSFSVRHIVKNQTFKRLES